MGDHAARGGEDIEALYPPEPAPDAQALEAGRRIFAGECRFIAAAHNPEDLPPDRLPEVAFLGRSNVGKSSLVNAVTGRNSLARVSRTPGRTRQIIFFELDRLMLVDLPGYGFASAPKTEIARWNGLVSLYLKGRAGLKRVLLLIDARQGVKPADEEFMALFDEAAVSFQLVLTKLDKLPERELPERLGEIAAAAARHTAGHPQLHLTSAQKGFGIAELRAALGALAAPGAAG
jgi:GTP-binding protein